MAVVDPLGSCQVNPGSCGTRPGVVRRRPGEWRSSRNDCPKRLVHNARRVPTKLDGEVRGLIANRHWRCATLTRSRCRGWPCSARACLVTGTRARLPAERLLTPGSDDCLLASVMKSRMVRRVGGAGGAVGSFAQPSSIRAWWAQGLCFMLPLVANFLPETLINKYIFSGAVFFSGLFSCLSTPVPQALTVHQLGC